MLEISYGSSRSETVGIVEIRKKIIFVNSPTMSHKASLNIFVKWKENQGKLNNSEFLRYDTDDSIRFQEIP